MKKPDDLKLSDGLIKAWFKAVENNDTKIQEECLASGIPINLNGGWNKSTALMHAACDAHFESIYFLLTHGADITLKNSRGINALEHLLRQFIHYEETEQKTNPESVRKSAYLLIAYGLPNNHFTKHLAPSIEQVRGKIKNYNKKNLAGMLHCLEEIAPYKRLSPIINDITLRKDLTPRAIQKKKNDFLNTYNKIIQKHLPEDTTSIVYDYLSIKHEINNLVFRSIERPGKKDNKTTSCRLL